MHRHAQRLALALLFAAGAVYGQTVPLPLAVTVANLPTCNATRDAQVYGVRDADTPVVGDVVVGGGTENVVVQCDNAAAGIKWVVKATDSGGGGGGASTFDELGSGTNTTATMTVGTGASMLTSGSGTIAATSASDLTCTDCINDTEISTNAGTALSADLEEETHATEHSLGGTDAVTVTNLASACTDVQVTGGTAAGTGVECQTDDDVPESGDFGAGVDLEADGSLSADVVAAAEMADADHGDVAWSGGVASVEDDSHNHGAGTIAGLDAGDTTTGTFADARVDGSAEADELVLAGDVDGTANANDLDEAAVETELEAVLDLDALQGQIADAQIADGAVDGGTGGEIADASVTAADLGTDSVSADELAAAGVEAELEAVIDLADLQGDLALGTKTSGNYAAGDAEAGAALTGDSATAFFSAGAVEDARIDAAIHRDSETKDGDLVSFDDGDSNFAATDVDEAIEELDDDNASGPNASDGKVEWSQLVGVPAGFADETDDGGGGGMPAKVFQWAASGLEPVDPDDVIAPLALDQGTNNDSLGRLFDASTDECVKAPPFVIPAEVDSAGNAVFFIYTKAVTAPGVDGTADDADWYIKEAEVGDGETDDPSLTSRDCLLQDYTASQDLVERGTCSIAISTLGWAANDLIQLYYCRDANDGGGIDSLVGDAFMSAAGVEVPRS